jgi:hypothetical protein
VPLLPPPPSIVLPPPPPPVVALLTPTDDRSVLLTASREVPMIPEAASLGLLGLSLVVLGGCAGWQWWRRRPPPGAHRP